MSLISKQIDELRAYAKDRKGELAKLINDAADTIEMLSAKIQTAIENEPGEDVTPVVHAHWDVIDGDSEGYEEFVHVWETLRCSRCGMERTTEDGYMPQYCEDCGAKMDEKEKTNETD